MKNIFRILFSSCLFMTILMMIGCSETDEPSISQASSFNDLKFVVNVTTGSNGTRAASSKKDWTVGDKILVAIDGNEDDLCNLQYQGDGEWAVTKYNDQSNFQNDKGKLTAVHADSLYKDANTTITGGDVLYTKEGSYTKHGDVVEINLKMNQRPVSRIAIVGMDKSCWIDGLEEYSHLNSLVSMTWDTSYHSNGELCKEVYGDTCVFYGILPSENGNTTIKLVNKDGATYTRSFEGKSANAGDYILIGGPESKDADKWTSHVPVIGIEAKEKTVNLLVGDAGSVKDWYSLKPSKPTNSNVTYTSSNENVLSIASDGSYTVKGTGKTDVTITTEDGNYSCKIQVTVQDITDLVDLAETGTSVTITGGGVYYGRYFTVTNRSDYDITVTYLDGDVDGGSVEIKAHESHEFQNYYRVSGWMKTITLKFTCNSKQYEKSGSFEI